MNDKELMKKVYDRPCADELTAEQLLARSSDRARARVSHGAVYAAAAAAVLGVGAAIVMSRVTPPIDSKSLSAEQPAEIVSEAPGDTSPDSGGGASYDVIVNDDGSSGSSTARSSGESASLSESDSASNESEPEAAGLHDKESSSEEESLPDDQPEPISSRSNDTQSESDASSAAEDSHETESGAETVIWTEPEIKKYTYEDGSPQHYWLPEDVSCVDVDTLTVPEKFDVPPEEEQELEDEIDQNASEYCRGFDYRYDKAISFCYAERADFAAADSIEGLTENRNKYYMVPFNENNYMGMAEYYSEYNYWDGQKVFTHSISAGTGEIFEELYEGLGEFDALLDSFYAHSDEKVFVDNFWSFTVLLFKSGGEEYAAVKYLTDQYYDITSDAPGELIPYRYSSFREWARRPTDHSAPSLNSVTYIDYGTNIRRCEIIGAEKMQAFEDMYERYKEDIPANSGRMLTITNGEYRFEPCGGQAFADLTAPDGRRISFSKLYGSKYSGITMQVLDPDTGKRTVIWFDDSEYDNSALNALFDEAVGKMK